MATPGLCGALRVSATGDWSLESAACDAAAASVLCVNGAVGALAAGNVPVAAGLEMWPGLHCYVLVHLSILT